MCRDSLAFPSTGWDVQGPPVGRQEAGELLGTPHRHSILPPTHPRCGPGCQQPPQKKLLSTNPVPKPPALLLQRHGLAQQPPSHGSPTQAHCQPGSTAGKAQQQSIHPSTEGPSPPASLPPDHLSSCLWHWTQSLINDVPLNYISSPSHIYIC